MDNWCSYFQTLYIYETQTHISKIEFVTSFFDVSMSDFYLYILKKYLSIPLLVLCIPILGGPALQCTLRSLSRIVCRGQEGIKAVKALWGLISRPILYLGFFYSPYVPIRNRKEFLRKSWYSTISSFSLLFLWSLTSAREDTNTNKWHCLKWLTQCQRPCDCLKWAWNCLKRSWFAESGQANALRFFHVYLPVLNLTPRAIENWPWSTYSLA